MVALPVIFYSSYSITVRHVIVISDLVFYTASWRCIACIRSIDALRIPFQDYGPDEVAKKRLIGEYGRGEIVGLVETLMQVLTCFAPY